MSGVTKIPDKVFASKTNVNKIDIVIPNTVLEMGNNAFENINLKSLTFEKNSKLKTISNEAFKNIYKDDNSIDLVIPSSVVKIGNYAFSNVNIKKLEFNNDNNSSLLDEIGDNAFGQDKERDKSSCSDCSLIIPPYVNRLGNQSFRNLGYKKLEFSVKEGNTLSLNIGEKAFEGNPFEKVILSDHISNGTNIFGDQNIGSVKDEIVLKTTSFENSNKMFTNNFCNLLYGKECNSSKLNDESVTYKYSYNGKDKYISYGGLYNE